MKNRNKTIVFLLESYPVDSQAFITNQIIGVLKAGYNVKVSVNKLNKVEGSSQEAMIRKHHILERLEVTGTNNPNNGFKRWFSLLTLCFRNKRLIPMFFVILKSNSVDKLRMCHKLVGFKPILKGELFHVQFANNGFFIVKLKELGLLKKESKIVTTFHGYDAHTTSDNFQVRKEQLAPIFKYSDHIIVNSNYLKNQVLHLGSPKEKIHRIGVAYNSELFKFNRRQSTGEVKLISIGRLVELKGHIYGLKTIKKLLDLGLKVHYTIIGEGPERENLTKVIGDYGLGNTVCLLGAKSQTDIFEYLSESTLFLMTSIADGKKQCEAFGVVSVEAQAVGVPVIAFNSGGVATTIKEGFSGFLVKEKDSDAMVNVVLQLLNNKTQLEKMSLNASNFAKENFGLEKIIEEHIKIYES